MNLPPFFDFLTVSFAPEKWYFYLFYSSSESLMLFFVCTIRNGLFEQGAYWRIEREVCGLPEPAWYIPVRVRGANI